MTIANWTTNASGDWNTGSLWSGGVVPNAGSVDVTIDALTSATYTVTIAAGQTQTVHSLALNTVNNFDRAQYPYSYAAAALELDGTLIFAAGSAGSLAGAPQSYIHVAAHKNAAILNGGTLAGFFQVEGNLLLTGTNSVYISNEIQALAGTVTINAPVADIRGSTLIDGFFDAKGAGATINLGGTVIGSANRIVNIATLAGPSFGWTELSLNGVTTAINEWNGSAYTSIETTLTTIGDGATVDVLGGRNYTTSNALTIDATIGSSVLNSIFNLQAGTVTVGGGININKGIVQGYGTIANNVVNNSTLIALGGSVGGTLDLIGNLTGTGVVTFDLNAATGIADPTAATLVLGTVSAGQTVTLNTGNDILVLATPFAFAGTIAAATGGQIVLQGLTATSAVLTNGTLVVSNGTLVVGSLALAGSYVGDTFTATGSVITVGAPISPSIAGAIAGQAVTDQGTIAPFAGVVIADRNFRALETITVSLSAPGNGTLTHLGGGQYDPVSGLYTTSGSPAAVTAALEGLVFVPTPRQVAPGGSVSTRFIITDLDTFGQSTSNTTTTVTTTVTAVAPAITGAVGGQVINAPGTIAPFAHVTIADANIGQTETVTINQFAPDFGTLIPLSGIGTYVAATGVYTVVGSAGFVTAALNGLLFVPAGAPGQSITTSFSIFDSDTASQSVRDTTTSVTATFPYVPPTITLATATRSVTDLAATTPLAGVVVADMNIGQTETVTVTLSSTANGTLSVLGGGSYVGGVYTIIGDTGSVSAALTGLVFTPNPHQVVPGASISTQFIINDVDSASQVATTRTATVVATAVAVPPTILNTTAGLVILDRGTIAPFPLVQIGDVNIGQTETVTVTLSAAANGTLTNLGSGTYDRATGVYTVVGDATAVSAALNGLIFVPTQGQVAPGGTVATRFTISDVDTAQQTTIDNTTTVIATAGTVAPRISGATSGQATTDQAAITPFAHVAVTDANFGQTETVTVSFFSGANGTLTSLPGVGSFSGGVYTVVGSASVVTAALNGLLFTPTLHQVAPGGSITTNFNIHDTDSAAQSANDTTTSVTATAVAVPPTIDGCRVSQAVTDQTAIRPFATVVIADANLGQTETVTVGLSIPANGILSNLGSGTYNPSTGVYTVIGTAEAVTAALDALVFTPTPYQVAPGGTVTTTFTITDTDTAGDSSNATASVIATAGMVKPTISGGLAAQPVANQDTIKPFSAVVIADANFGQIETVTVSLSNAANGTLGNLNGGSYNAATGVYTVTGSTTAVNAALNDLTFTPTQHQMPPGGTVTTGFTITDTDTAGATASSSVTSVIFTTGTVMPTIRGGLAGQATSDQAAIMPFATMVIADGNIGQTETVTVALSVPANGTLRNPNAGSYNSSTGIYTVIGTPGAVTAALNHLVFTPTSHQKAPGGTVTTRFTITDTDTAGVTITDGTTSVVTTAIATQPTIGGTQAGQRTTDIVAITPFAAVVIADANFGQTETITVTLSSPANGTLSNLSTGSYNPTTGVYTFSGSAASATTALHAILFTPTPHQLAAGGNVVTGFTIRDTDTAGAQAVPNAVTSVIVTATPPSGVVNNPDGTSLLTVYSQGGPSIKTITKYSGLNNTGAIVSQVVDNTNGTSYLRAFNPTPSVAKMTSEYSGLDNVGAKISDVVNNNNGSTLIYAYNPTATVLLTAQTWTATNPADGSPAGAKISDVVNNTDGTAAIYQYNPSPSVKLNVTKFGSFDRATGAPSGPEISDILNNADGTSILYAYNPTPWVSQTASFYSATDPSNGAPAGIVTQEVFNFAAGGSSVTRGGVTTYYSGPDGTGAVTSGAFLPMLSSPFRVASTPDTAVITFSGSGQSVDPGAGSHTIQFIAGATDDTLVLHLGGSARIFGFDPAAGDMLDLHTLLNEAHLTIAPETSQLSRYLSLSSVDGAVQVWFDRAAQGGGSQIASLIDSSRLLAQLQTFGPFRL